MSQNSHQLGRLRQEDTSNPEFEANWATFEILCPKPKILKTGSLGWAQWLKPVILPTWEAETGRITI
jgi:hypothetical protein